VVEIEDDFLAFSLPGALGSFGGSLLPVILKGCLAEGNRLGNHSRCDFSRGDFSRG